MIFVAEDVGQHGKLVAFEDQAHRDAGDVRLHRHAGVHQREAAAAHRSHRRRTVRFGDFRHDADRVAEFVGARQARSQRALGQTAVTDFTALRRTDAARFAGRERRHVVVEHEAFAVLAFERVDVLLVALRAERCDHQCLRFAAREQRRTVGTRQHAGTDFDRAHGARVAAVDTRFAVQDLRTDDLRFDVEQHVADGCLVGCDRTGCSCVFFQLRRRRCVDFLQLGRTRLLVADLVSGEQVGLRQFRHACDQRLVLRSRLPVPFRLAAFTDQLMDRVDRDLHLLVTEHHGAEHHFFAQLLRFRFHHQHRAFRTGDDQVERRFLHLRTRRVQHVFVVDVGHACCADRAVERQTGHSERRRRADQRGDVSGDFGVQRQDVDHDLDFVVEAFREQRTQRTVDQARDQRFAFRRTAFATEETTRDLAGGVGLFEVIDGQREEVLARLGGLGADHSGQHDGIFDVDDHSTARLTSDFARFEANVMLAPLKFFDDFIEHSHCFSSIVMPRGPEAARQRQDRRRMGRGVLCHSREPRYEYAREPLE